MSGFKKKTLMNTSIQKKSIPDTVIQTLILLLVVIWCILIIFPFTNILTWSLILALALLPAHKALTKWTGNKPKLAAFILVAGILVSVILPASLLVDSLVDEAKQIKEAYQNETLSIPPPSEKIKDWPIFGENLYSAWESASVNLEQTLEKYNEIIVSFVKKLGKGIFDSISGIFQIIIALIIAGFLLVVEGLGESIRKFFRKVAGDRGDEFADTTLITVSSVVKGILGVALIVGILHGFIFMLARIPFAGIWTLLVFVLCILQLPAIFVTLPIIIYIFSVTDTTMAIVWAVLLLVAGLSDNVLKPILLGKGAPVPMLVIFVGVIGGFMFSGFIGLFTGAIILSIGYKLFLGWVKSGEVIE
jgi:predicted PurR-regulated permease PerM